MAKVTVMVKTAEIGDAFATETFNTRKEATDAINKRFDVYHTSSWHGTISEFFTSDFDIWQTHILILEQDSMGTVTILGHDGFTETKTYVLDGLKTRRAF